MRLLLAALALAGFCSAPGHAQIYKYVDQRGLIHLTNVPLAHASRASPYSELIDRAARDYQLNPKLLHAVIRTESDYRPDAVSRKGAVGLMQLMPATAARYGVHDPRDPAQNIRGGALYLRDLLRRFDDDLPLTLAAYNAGEDAVLRYGAIPPYPETTRYVRTVLGHYANTVYPAVRIGSSR